MRQLISLLAIAFSLHVQAQNITISGYLEDAASGEKLIAANVYDSNSAKGTISNNFGFYSLTIPVGKVSLDFSYIGYTSQKIVLDISEDRVLNIALQQAHTLDVVEIIAEESKRIAEESQMSVVEIPVQQIKEIPAFLGEVDVLKALQLLPGVQSGGEGQSGLYIRGGSPDQNLILLDGVPVYNASHLFGFFSVFNADAIKDVKLIKGGFPARYGGRLSSVLEINLKEGNRNKFHGAGSIGIVASKLTLEGPIINDKTSFLVSGRRTYIDLLARPFIKSNFEDNDSEGGTGYYFYDVNAKINHKIDENNRLYFSFYTGKDNFYFSEKDKDFDEREFTDNTLEWGNITAAARWNHIWSQKLFSNTMFSLSDYKLNTGAAFGTEFNDEAIREEISLNYISGIRDLSAKIDFDYLPSPEHFIRFGLHTTNHLFKPGVFDLLDINTEEEFNFEQTVGQRNITALEMSAYLEDDWKISDQLKMNLGLHYSAFAVEGKFYNALQPRLSGRYLINDELSLKASFSTMRQYIHLLAFEGVGLPTDLWLPTTESIKPQDAYQFAAGVAKNIGKKYELTIEGYYKKMKNLISYKEGRGLFEFTDWQTRVTQGDGSSYGAELFLQKKIGRFTGWIGYTLSWTYRQFDDVNFGKKFPYRYDRRHDISLVGQYKLSKKINIGGTWVYGTGNAVTLPNAKVLGFSQGQENFSGNYIENYYSERNGYRMRSYHRFDLGISFVKKKKRHTRTWSIGAYNTYNRQNPFFVFEDTDNVNGEREYKLKQASLFPIIPYINYSFKF